MLKKIFAVWILMFAPAACVWAVPCPTVTLDQIVASSAGCTIGNLTFNFFGGYDQPDAGSGFQTVDASTILFTPEAGDPNGPGFMLSAAPGSSLFGGDFASQRDSLDFEASESSLFSADVITDVSDALYGPSGTILVPKSFEFFTYAAAAILGFVPDACETGYVQSHFGEANTFPVNYVPSNSGTFSGCGNLKNAQFISELNLGTENATISVASADFYVDEGPPSAGTGGGNGGGGGTGGGTTAPEPSSLLLLASGLCGLGSIKRGWKFARQ